MSITIYHNPRCGTSRNVLGLIRNAGIEPTIIEYLANPPSRVELATLVDRMGLTPRELMRTKNTPAEAMGLTDPARTDDEILDAMAAHPILINRPIVVTSLGVRLCRPSQTVLDIVPAPQRGEFRKEDGEIVVDANGRRVA